MVNQSEEDFLSSYDPTAFPPVAVSVDVAALTLNEGVLSVLAIERSQHPFAGHWALPGTFPKPGEDIYLAAIRGLVEKTNVSPPHFEQLASFGSPDRDPRMRVVSIGYLSIGPFADMPVAGYHAKQAEWLPVHDHPYKWAFDHEKIVTEAVSRLQSKLEYSAMAIRFLPEMFTIAELRKVYEAVWDRHLDPGNFQRKVTTAKGFLEAMPAKRGTSRLYRAGAAKLLYPPILQEPRKRS